MLSTGAAAIALNPINTEMKIGAYLKDCSLENCSVKIHSMWIIPEPRAELSPWKDLCLFPS